MAMHHCRPGEVAHLGPISDTTIQTSALARTASFEAVHLIVRAGQSIAPHHVAGPITLYCISGHVRFQGATPPDLRGGDWLFLAPGTLHAVQAVEDSALLLTILFNESDAGQRPLGPFDAAL